MSDVICSLALQAMTDSPTLYVLGDAVQETRWYDSRMARYNYHTNPNEDYTNEQSHFEVATRPTSRWARAIASILLFDSWSQTIWECAKRAHDGNWVSHNAEDIWPSAINDNRNWPLQQRVQQRPILYPNEGKTVKTTPYIMALSQISIEPGMSGIISDNPQIMFRGKRLVIPSTVCDSIVVTDIGAANQRFNIGAGGMPGRMFSEEAIPFDLDLPTLSPANTIRITMINIGRRTVIVRPALYGISTWGM